MKSTRERTIEVTGDPLVQNVLEIGVSGGLGLRLASGLALRLGSRLGLVFTLKLQSVGVRVG